MEIIPTIMEHNWYQVKLKNKFFGIKYIKIGVEIFLIKKLEKILFLRTFWKLFNNSLKKDYFFIFVITIIS